MGKEVGNDNREKKQSLQMLDLTKTSNGHLTCIHRIKEIMLKEGRYDNKGIEITFLKMEIQTLKRLK